MKVFYKSLAKNALLTIIIIHLAFWGFSATYYVSSSGNDLNSGLSTSLPWKTLGKVNAFAFVPGDQILFKRGDTFYGSLTISQSGTSSSRIVYGAYGAGANPIITGLTAVTSWTNLGSNIWESTNAVSTLSDLNMVVINGVNTGMGRHPNTGYFYYQSHSGSTSITSNNLNGTPNWTGAELAFNNTPYTIKRCPITSQTGSTLNFTKDPHDGLILKDGLKFIIQNDARTLDVQNEWYYNPSTKKLRVYSTSQPSNVKVSTIEVLVTNTSKHYITIDNISFVGSNSKTVQLTSSNYFVLQNCQIDFSGFDAIYGGYSTCSNMRIENCTISNSNNGGIGVTSYFPNAIIRANTITNTGIIYGANTRLVSGTNNAGICTGISALGDGTLIENNVISNSGYCGIKFLGNNSVVQKNLVTNFCLTNNDGGGIYTWNGPNTTYTGTKILDNVVVGTSANGASSDVDMDGCIYLDDYSNGIEIAGNSLSGAEFGVFLHEAHDVVVQGNTTFNNDKGIRIYGRPSPFYMNNITVQNNIVVAKTSGQLAIHFDPLELVKPTFKSSNNCYARPISDSKTIVGYIRTPSFSSISNTVSEWQTYSGQDANSTKSPQSVTSESDIRYEYNETNTAKTVTLSQPMMDMRGVKHSGSIILQPFKSVVLIKDATSATVPGAPTSVVATAGNASASVTFAAPASNGGSAITGYTVTSSPAGGVDASAGSTSLTRAITGLTNGTAYTFTVKASNSIGTSGASAPSNSVTPQAPLTATSYTFTGPSSGNVNSASSNFTVTPNNPYTGTITITPSGTGSTGLSSVVLNFSNSSTAQTFKITPSVAGTVLLTPSNAGSLSNPASLSYSSLAVVPDAPTSVVASAGNASASVSFVAPANNGGSAITGYTVTSSPAGGVDANAGSTSLVRTITGLTNGTFYTFTVKATNSAGASAASLPSNSVKPVAPSDNTAPVISSFLMPTSATSLTVSITAFNASDNIGVSGYLLTETPAVPSSSATGWTTTAPASYSFSSAGINSVYGWVKDAAGNVSSSAMQTVTITLETKQGELKPSHFIPVWNGENGQNHMNFIVVSAIHEDMPLTADDEIGLFSGNTCVGAQILSKEINSADNSTYLTIQASQNDGSDNGFNNNDSIIVRIWDNSANAELFAKAVVYRNDMPTWTTSGKYSAGATAVIEIVSYIEYTQTIELKKGYNLISTNVTSDNTLACHITQPLVDQGNLIKVQDEAGNSLEDWGSFGGWVNNIGTIKVTEGYKIKVADNCSLQVTGRFVALPLDISLMNGWNIISFPRTDMVDAMAVVQSLIDQGKLVKVQDEAGNSIENWGIYGGWKNGIGNFIPGKAYKIKMNADATLTIHENYLKSSVIFAQAEATSYYRTKTEGNGTDHMNINIVGLLEAGVSVGDELAAFDGKICVGTLKITASHLNTGTACLVASSADDKGLVGFKSGNKIQVYSWNQVTGNETEVQTEVVKGQLNYEINGSVMVKLKSASINVDVIDEFVKIDVFPNPSSGRVTVRFSEMPDAGSKIEITDAAGRMISSRLISDISEEFNLDQQSGGLYLVKTILGSNTTIHKLVIRK